MGPNGKAWLQLRKGGRRELSVKRTADTDESLKHNEVLKARYNFQNIQLFFLKSAVDNNEDVHTP